MNIQTLFDTLDVHIEGSVDDTIRKQYQVTKIKSQFIHCQVFNSYFTEKNVDTYTNWLRDLSLAHYMIPLGSCTMKLYAIKDNLNNMTRKTIQNFN